MNRKYRCLGFFMTILMLLAMPRMSVGATESGDEIAQAAKHGVVRVVSLMKTTYYDSEGNYVTTANGYGSGSGFGVGTAGQETDVFATNRHVVAVESGKTVINGQIYYTESQLVGYYILLDNYAYNTQTFTLDNSRAIPCKLLYVGEDEDADIAILRAAEPVPGRVALPLLDDEGSLAVTAKVTALGYPGSSDDATSDGYMLADLDSMTLTLGAVARFASISRDSVGALTGDLIQHTATINHGNSGGPLIDANGAVVGLNTYGTGQDIQTGDVNSYYAIRIKYAKDALDSLGIAYDVYVPKSGNNIVWIIVIAVVVIAAAAAVALILLKKKKAAPDAGKAGTAGKASKQPQRAFIRSMAVQHNGLALVVGAAPIMIGRDPANCKLVYVEGTTGVSGRHCSVSYDAAAGEFIVTDMRSTYGTFLLGGQKLNANVPCRLKPGDSFYVGDKANVIRLELG